MTIESLFGLLVCQRGGTKGSAVNDIDRRSRKIYAVGAIEVKKPEPKIWEQILRLC